MKARKAEEESLTKRMNDEGGEGKGLMELTKRRQSSIDREDSHSFTLIFY